MLRTVSACHRPRKSAAERWEQRQRAEARIIDKILSGCHSLSSHRGSRPTKLLSALSHLLSHADDATCETYQDQATCNAPTTPFFDLDSLENKFDENDSACEVLKESPTMAAPIFQDEDMAPVVNDIVLDLDSLLTRVEDEFAHMQVMKEQLTNEGVQLEADIQGAFGRIREIAQLRSDRPSALSQHDIDTLYSETIARNERMHAVRARLEFLEIRFGKFNEIINRGRFLMSSAFDSPPSISRRDLSELVADFEDQHDG